MEVLIIKLNSEVNGSIILSISSTNIILLLFSNNKFEFSAIPYTSHELENAYHDFELPKPEYAVITVSSKQAGVGGNDSWGQWIYDEYKVFGTDKQLLEFSIEKY